MNQAREQITPYGLGRLEMLQTLTDALKLNENVIFDIYASVNVYAVLLEQVRKYPWNNAVKVAVQGAISYALESESEQLKESVSFSFYCFV